MNTASQSAWTYASDEGEFTLLSSGDSDIQAKGAAAAREHSLRALGDPELAITGFKELEVDWGRRAECNDPEWRRVLCRHEGKKSGESEEVLHRCYAEVCEDTL